MAWSTPVLHAVGDILTASDWNISSNDIALLGGSAGTGFGNPESTTSGTYVDLPTVGPTVTILTGAHAFVALTASMSNNSSPFYAFMGYNVSGATTIAAADGQAAGGQLGINPNQSFNMSATYPIGLNPGTNTFTAKYKAGAGGTASFSNRNICVWALP